MREITAIIPAAGIGKRFSSTGKKQFFEIDGKTILEYTLRSLSAYPFDAFVIGAAPDDFERISEIASTAGIEGKLTLTAGGKERSDTVLACLKKVETPFVAVHDAVRPFISEALLRTVVNAAFAWGGAICALRAHDTVKRVKNGSVLTTIPRDEVYLAHTPQVFETEVLTAAIESAVQDGIILTDEASAYECAKRRVVVVDSTPDNIKVTEAADLTLAKALIEKYSFLR